MSKENKKQPQPKRQFWQRHTPQAEPSLAHYVSPLQAALFEARLKPFSYAMGELRLEFGHMECETIHYLCAQHMDRLTALLQPIKLRALKRNPELKKFLLLPLEKQPLPPRLYKALHAKGYRNLAEVAEKGEMELRKIRRLGRVSRQYLRELFHLHGCGALFPYNKVLHRE